MKQFEQVARISFSVPGSDGDLLSQVDDATGGSSGGHEGSGGDGETHFDFVWLVGGSLGGVFVRS